MNPIQALSREFSVSETRIEAVIALLDEGNTVPFIARYRKEKTGAMDDVTLRRLEERLSYLRSLETRREEVRHTIEELGKMTPELAERLDKATILAEIEDIYLPFRPKRRTRAGIAREKGLEPLAEKLLLQDQTDPLTEAASFIDAEKGVETAEDALQGAMDIVAEDISDNADHRGELRRLFRKEGLFRTVAVKDAELGVYAMYEDFSQKIAAIPSHRVLAADRGEKEGVLKVTALPEEGLALQLLTCALVKENSPWAPYMTRTVEDSYRRLLCPSLEREIRGELTDAAHESAITLFSENLKNLLLCPPVKGKTVLGFDPGYRTGCKLAVVDPTGKVLTTGVIYPTKPREDVRGAEETLLSLFEKYGVDVVAIGNGTASGESELFVSELIRKKDLSVKYAMVSESGASVYSASPLGAEEFPDFDVTVRSAVSIARRLQDPLAELVKIDPKSIGVGQYQHDMKPARLSAALEGVVENCVNRVGVDLNTASFMLLSYVAGLTKTTAKAIVAHREAKGAFRSREELKKVKGIGPAAFRQCAGFLRIPGGTEELDNTGVHPESYEAARGLLSRLKAKAGQPLAASYEAAGKKALAEALGVGEMTLTDIVLELEKPGRDLRDDLEMPPLRSGALTLEELKDGEEYDGTVRNVCDFGAFVDIGVHQDGLVHISQLSDRFVKHPSQVVSVGQRVRVRVLSVDRVKKKISLTMKGLNKN